MFASSSNQQNNSPTTVDQYFYQNRAKFSEETENRYFGALRAQGYLCNHQGKGFFGSVLLLSPNVILAIGHCFPDTTGYVRFQTSLHAVTSFIDGEIDGMGGVDYKLLKPTTPVNIELPFLCTSPPVGKCLHIYHARTPYDPTNRTQPIEQYVKEYESKDTAPYACRSDIANIKTNPGECCASRFSLSTGAIHAVHQGSSEALLLNTVLLDIEWIVSRNRPKRNLAKAALDEILSCKKIIAWETRRMDNPVFTLGKGHVEPEGPQQKIEVIRGNAYEPPTYLPNEQYYADAVQALEQINFDHLWGNEGTIANHGLARIDIQRDAGNYQNIQVQMNLQKKQGQKTSFAGILLDKSFSQTVVSDQQACILNTFKKKMRTALHEAQYKQEFYFWHINNTLELNNNNNQQAGGSNSNNLDKQKKATK